MIAMLLAAASPSAAPFEPMAFLAGRCFTATLPDGRVVGDGETLHFTGDYVSGTERRDVRATWTRDGEGYRARSEERTGEAPGQPTSDLHFAPDARTRPECD